MAKQIRNGMTGIDIITVNIIWSFAPNFRPQLLNIWQYERLTIISLPSWVIEKSEHHWSSKKKHNSNVLHLPVKSSIRWES